MDSTRSYASYRVEGRPLPDRSADLRRTKSLIRWEAAIQRFRAAPCSEGVDAASQSAWAANRFSSSSISGASSVSMRFGDIPIHQRSNCRADSRRVNENLSDTKALNCPWGGEMGSRGTQPLETKLRGIQFLTRTQGRGQMFDAERAPASHRRKDAGALNSSLKFRVGTGGWLRLWGNSAWSVNGPVARCAGRTGTQQTPAAQCSPAGASDQRTPERPSAPIRCGS